MTIARDARGRFARKSSTTIITKRRGKLLYLLILALFFLCCPGQSIYLRPIAGASENREIRSLPFELPKPALYPQVTGTQYPQEGITAASGVVLDHESGVIVFEKNPDMLLPPASTTKLLTALVAMDAYDLEDVITIESVVREGQVMGLVSGEQITVENLLYGILIQSGNDAAFALADRFPGKRIAFVQAMNAKARELGMESSMFTNPAGFDDPQHKVTALDLAKLSQAALRDKTIAKIVGIPRITISDISHTVYHDLINVNQLVGTIPGVAGIKTGWTTQAGENLITLVRRNGHAVIIIVLGSQDRFLDTQNLITWVFTNVTWIDYSKQLEHELTGTEPSQPNLD